jgi:hypothetical protein
MGILVACACGFRLEARDALAGRKIKCPTCREPITVPGVIDPAAPRRSLPRGSGGRDLRMEAHYKAIAIWYRLGGYLTLAAGLVVLLMFIASPGRYDLPGLALRLAATFGVGGLCLVIGIYLARFANQARLVAAVLTVLSALGQFAQVARRPGHSLSAAISLAILAAFLWAFLSKRGAALCSEEYAEKMAQTPHLKPATFASPFFWGFLLLFALLAVLLLLLLVALSRFIDD